MSTMYPALPKLAVRDSFDDDDLTDIDDEVFIRDGKNCSLKLDDDGGVKRPLMAPRRKYRKSCGFETHKFPYRALFAPLCYGVMALVVLLSLIILCIFTVNIFPMPLTILRNWLSREPKEVSMDSNVVPCTSLTTKILWTRSLPKLASESPIRSTDVNGDGVEDIILGFSTGLDPTDSPEYICASYFEGQIPCLGGVLALNGKTGDTLWTHWTGSIVSTIDCSLDLTNDKTKDCIISGPGILHAINGYDGSSVWETPITDISTFERQETSDIYNGKFITDIDGDGIGDVIASHTSQIQLDEAQSSKILLISGAKGNVMHSLSLPNMEQIFLAPQKLIHPDGESMFVVVTSSEKETGGLYIVPEVNLIHGNLKLRKLHHDTGKGVALPPILVDITSDGVEDIVVAIYNSTVITYNGLTFEPIWNYTIPNSKLLFIPVPGYYNDDDVPDFMVKYQIDSGLSYTTATIIDGKTGEPLLDKPTDGSLSKEMSGVSITVDGFGNDWFLHWSIDCLNYEKGNLKYQNQERENLSPELHADLCKVRFNSTLTANLFALSQHVGPPGMSLYSSEDWTTLEFLKNENPVINPVNTKKYVHNEADYEERKKFVSTDFQDDKWPLENEQANKDYDLSYDFDDNVDTGGQRSIDYPQVDEIRQQRSNVDDTIMDSESVENQNAVLKKYNNITSIKVRDNGLDDTRMINMIEQSHADVDVIADEVASVDKGTNTQERKRAINFSEKDSMDTRNLTEKNTIMIMSTTLAPNRRDTANITFTTEKAYYNDTLKLIGSERSFYNETEEHQEKKVVTQVYAHNVPNIIQNKEEDENIEKIFKRESLKNQNNERTVKEQLTVLPINLNHHQVKLKKPRIKRETQSENYNIFGIQQQPLTGILLPSILESKGKTSVDLIFSTFWLPPPVESPPLSQRYFDCIQRKKGFLKKRFQHRRNNDIIKECFEEQRFNNNVLREAEDRENFKITFGQMTVYRMKIECVCPEDMLANQSCKNISAHQSWPEHLGSLGNGYFKSIQKSSV